MNLRKIEDQLNKKNAIPQNCLHIYRKTLVSLKIAVVNYM